MTSVTAEVPCERRSERNALRDCPEDHAKLGGLACVDASDRVFENPADDMAVDVGETAGDPVVVEGEFFVVEAQ